MSGLSKNLTIEVIDLSQNPQVYARFLEEQQLALHNFGVADGSIPVEASNLPPGECAVIARNETGDLIAGVRVFTRSVSRPLPIESESSPLSLQQRAMISAESNLCELGALWVAPYAAGRFLSRRMAAHATVLAYRLGFEETISLSHVRAFKLISGPLGYERDFAFPTMSYPDERFETIVIRFRKGLVAALRNVEEEEIPATVLQSPGPASVLVNNP